MNNITAYTGKYKQECINYSPKDQNINYSRINMETRKFQYRSNKNNFSNFSYISKSYDNVQKNSIINNNIHINISTINSNMISYRNNYYNDYY